MQKTISTIKTIKLVSLVLALYLVTPWLCATVVSNQQTQPTDTLTIESNQGFATAPKEQALGMN